MTSFRFSFFASFRMNGKTSGLGMPFSHPSWRVEGKPWAAEAQLMSPTSATLPRTPNRPRPGAFVPSLSFMHQLF